MTKKAALALLATAPLSIGGYGCPSTSAIPVATATLATPGDGSERRVVQRSILRSSHAGAYEDGTPQRTAGSPDPSVAEWPQWPYRAACNQMTFDPTDVFAASTDAERGTRPSERALRRLLSRNEPFPLPDHGWRLASAPPGRALFLHGRPGAELESGKELQSMELRRRRGHWKMRSYSQICYPFTVRRGRQATTWFLAKSQPALTSSTSRIRIDVGAPCLEGEDLAAQAEPPVFNQIDGKLVLTIWLRPRRNTSLQACEESASKGRPLVVDLPQPLGDRELFDGGLFPPSPAVHLPRPKVVFGRSPAGDARRSDIFG